MNAGTGDKILLEGGVPPLTRRLLAMLALLLLTAWAVRVAAVTLSPRLIHADEAFQYLEPAHRMVFGYGIVTWEYREGLRSYLLPGLLAGLMEISSWVSDSPRVYLGVIHGVMAAISLTVVACGLGYGRRLLGPTGGLVVGWTCCVWPELVLFGPATLTEAVAAHTLIAGMFLLWRSAEGERVGIALAAGAVLGLTVALRMHLAPAAGVAGLMLLGRSPRRWAAAMVGGVGVLLAAGLLDAATWGTPFGSFYVNVKRNVIDGVASERFGDQPFWWYGNQLVQHWGGLLAVVAVLAVIGGRRHPALLVVPLVVIVSHSLIGHKEYRFIYPALPPLIIAAALGVADLVVRLSPPLAAGAGTGAGERVPGPPASSRWVVAGTLASVALVAAVHGRADMNWEMFRRDAAFALAVEEARRRPDLEGLALMGVEWGVFRGYHQLHREVPVYWAENPAALAEATELYDYVLVGSRFDEPPVDPPPGYSRVGEWWSMGKPVILYRREGTVRAAPERELNAVLERMGR